MLPVHAIRGLPGGNLVAPIPVGPGYQTAFSEAIRKESGIQTGTVGMITDPAQAAHVVRTGQADLVLIAREFLRDPYWPLHAAEALGENVPWPAQYLRAAHRTATARQPVAIRPESRNLLVNSSRQSG